MVILLVICSLGGPRDKRWESSEGSSNSAAGMHSLIEFVLLTRYNLKQAQMP